MANTPIRTVRVPDYIWFAVRDKAEQQDTTVSAIILSALKNYGGIDE